MKEIWILCAVVHWEGITELITSFENEESAKVGLLKAKKWLDEEHIWDRSNREESLKKEQEWKAQSPYPLLTHAWADDLEIFKTTMEPSDDDN